MGSQEATSAYPILILILHLLSLSSSYPLPRTNTLAPKVLKNHVRSAKQRMKKRVRNVLREAVRT